MKLTLFLLSAAAMVSAVSAATAADPVNLGTAGGYVILSKTGISTVPFSAITGNIAVSPIAAAAITGFNLEMDTSNTFAIDTTGQVSGEVYAADYTSPTPPDLTVAVLDMQTAYADVAGRASAAADLNLGAGLVAGMTFTPGVYKFTVDINIAGDIFLEGNDTDVFIMQTSAGILQAVGTKVILSGGVKPENIFWQVAGMVTVGAGAHMEGNLLVATSVAFITGSSLNGRILAQTAVTLQSATITKP
jgi:hypothetical protein